MTRIAFLALFARRPGSLLRIDRVERTGDVVIPGNAVEDEKLVLLDVVEEELILSLPMFAYHASCESEEYQNADETENTAEAYQQRQRPALGHDGNFAEEYLEEEQTLV